MKKHFLGCAFSLFFLFSITLYPPEREAEFITLLKQAQEGERMFFERIDGDGDLIEAEADLRSALYLYTYLYTWTGSWEALQSLVKLYRKTVQTSSLPVPRFGFLREGGIEGTLEPLPPPKVNFSGSYRIWVAEVSNYTTQAIMLKKNSFTMIDIHGKVYRNIPDPMEIPEIKARFSKNPLYFKPLEVYKGPRTAGGVKILFEEFKTLPAKIMWDLEDKGVIEFYFFENLFE
ncbi:MAG: hypothetical protein V2G48_00255 [bacterium JZ-2024 1]